MAWNKVSDYYFFVEDFVALIHVIRINFRVSMIIDNHGIIRESS